MEGLELVRDGAPQVAWWSRRLAPWHPWPMPVGALVPEGFEAYARLLHPVSIRSQEGRLPWSHVADWSGQPLEPTSFFGDVATRADGVSWATIGNAPDEGEFPEQMYRRLVAVLRLHTSRPDDCWYALWFGWGEMELDPSDVSLPVEITPEITGTGRRYLLYRGPLASMTQLRFFTGRFRPPSFWWPEDRTWFVSTEIDAWSTYLGGDASLVRELVHADGLEVFPSAIADPFDGMHPGQIARPWLPERQ